MYGQPPLLNLPRSLLSLCTAAVKAEILAGDENEIIPHLHHLPQELYDRLLPGLPPLALQKLFDQLPSNSLDDSESSESCPRNSRKRKRCVNFEESWRKLYESRWPDLYSAVKENENDWNQMYWETHLQTCLDSILEMALYKSFKGFLEVDIPDSCVKYTTWEGQKGNFSKLSYNCEQFGVYVRSLRLNVVHCVLDLSHFLRNANLEGLELVWIRTRDHVEGLCELLNQNKETLISLEFTHCKLSADILDEICDSLFIKDSQMYKIQQLSINYFGLLEHNPYFFPVGLKSLLSSSRSLNSLSLCENDITPYFVKMVFDTLIHTSSGIASLEISGNSISGWLSDFKWGPSNYSKLTFGEDKSLSSLRVLNLRNNNLCEDDMDCLNYALVLIPNLESLDLSENQIYDDGIRSLFPYFLKLSNRETPFLDLKLETCCLSPDGVTELLQVLSNLKKPLNSLSLKEDILGREMAVPLVKFLSTGIRSLNVEDSELDELAFVDMAKEIEKELKLVSINISKNRGKLETANFLSKLILSAPELVEINAGYNFMPLESLPVLASCLKAEKGKLERIDLSGNAHLYGKLSSLDEFRKNGKAMVTFSRTSIENTPYDDEP